MLPHGDRGLRIADIISRHNGNKARDSLSPTRLGLPYRQSMLISAHFANLLTFYSINVDLSSGEAGGVGGFASCVEQ
jgi:hypothetical protein